MYTEPCVRTLESWVDAALQRRDWLDPLRVSAEVLSARAVVLLWSDGAGAIRFHAAPEAPPPAFVRLCLDLSASNCTGVVEHRSLGADYAFWLVLPDRQTDRKIVFAVLSATVADIGLIRDIAVVAARSVVARLGLDALRATSALKTAAFDQLPFGVVIVDSQMRVAECNETCHTMLGRADGVTVLGDKLRCRDRADQVALQAAVNRALAGDLSDSIVKIRRANGVQPYVVRIVPPRGEEGGRTSCLLMIVDPDGEPSSSCDIWRLMFNLTDCELIIAEGLVSGRRIVDIATQRGVSVETIRSQTKRMFERLNVSSQAEAVLRLSRTALLRSITQHTGQRAHRSYV
jgi:DNA-binding NarL/FixJ family response regulator